MEVKANPKEEQMISNLTLNLKLLKERKNEIKKRRDDLQKQFEEKLATIGRRPRRTVEDLHDLIKDKEEEYETMPFTTKKDGENCLREIKYLQKEMNIAQQYESSDLELEKIKQERKNLLAELLKLKDMKNEIMSSISLYEVQKKINEYYKIDISTDKIESRELEIDPKNIGLVIGKNRSVLKKLEEEFKVAIITKDNMFTIYGMKKDIEEAIDTIKDISNQNTERFPLTMNLYRVLTAKQFEHLLRIQGMSRTFLDIKDIDVVEIRGGIKGINRAKLLINDLEKTSLKYQLTKPIIHRLIADKNQLLIKNSQDSGAQIYLDKTNGTLEIYGLESNLQIAKSSIDKFMNENKEINKKIMLDNWRIISYLIGQEESRIIDQIRKKSGAIFEFSKKEDTSCFIIIKGIEDEVKIAVGLLEVELERYKKCNIVIPSHAAAISLLLSNKGEKVKDLKDKYSVYITADRESQKIFISGKTEESANGAKNEINEMMKGLSLEAIEIDNYLVKLFIGKLGINLDQIINESGAYIRIDTSKDGSDAIITVSGLSDNVKKAKEMIQQFLIDNHLEKMEVEKRVLRFCIIGKKGEIIQKLQNEYNVQIDTKNELPNDKVMVIIRGHKDNVEKIKVELLEMIEKFKKENIFIKVSEDCISYSKILYKKNLDKIAGDTKTNIRFLREDNILLINGLCDDVNNAKNILESDLSKSFVLKINIKNDYLKYIFSRKREILNKLEDDFSVNIHCNPNDDYNSNNNYENNKVNENNKNNYKKKDKSNVDNKKGNKDETPVIFYGSNENCYKARNGLDEYLDNTVQIVKEIKCSKNQLLLFFKDNFFLTNEIEKESGVYITYPRQEEIDFKNDIYITLNGCIKAVNSANEMIQDVLNDRIRVKITLLNEFITTLERVKVDYSKLQKDTNTRIKLDGFILTIVGKIEDLNKATANIFIILQSNLPKYFYLHKINSDDAKILQYHSKDLEQYVLSNKCNMYLDKINLILRIYGYEKDISLISPLLLQFIDDLKGKHAYIPIDKSLIPIFIGKKGQNINKFQENNKVDTRVIEDHIIHLTGERDNVNNAILKINEFIELQKKLHQNIETTNDIIYSFKNYNNSFINHLIDETGVYINYEGNTISIRGNNEINVEKAIERINTKIEEIKIERKNRQQKEKEIKHIEETKPIEIPTNVPRIIPGLSSAKIVFPPGCSNSQKKNIKRSMKRKMASDQTNTENYLKILNQASNTIQTNNNNNYNNNNNQNEIERESNNNGELYEGNGYSIRF